MPVTDLVGACEILPALERCSGTRQEGRRATSHMEPPGQDDVEGHAYSWSDENLKQAVSRLENAVAALRALRTTSFR
jgi:hypothetical protein